MTKTFIRTTLAAVAALTLLPAIASAQTPNAPARKPIVAEQKAQAAKPATPRAQRHDGQRAEGKRGDHKRPGAQAHRDGKGGKSFAENDRRGDRDGRPGGQRGGKHDGQRDGQHRDHDKRGDHGKDGDRDNRRG